LASRIAREATSRAQAPRPQPKEANAKQ
jgi:hypothetical protein